MSMDFQLQTMNTFDSLVEGVKNYLQKAHRIEVLLFLHDHGIVKWGDIKKANICNDQTFRVSCVQLWQLGLVNRIALNRAGNRFSWRLNDNGCCIADIVKRAIRDIEVLGKSDMFIGRA